MRLREYLRPELVLLDLTARGVRDAIHVLVERLREQGIIGDAADLEEALLAREAAHTTAMGSGVAVPHATVPGLERPVIMVAIAPEGTTFGPVGLDPVRVFFVLLSPPNQTGLHIKLLARIARLVRRPGFIARLERATTPDAVLAEVERVDAGHV
ncbi:MAG TPA: PTS sugar transporter subunit IIA [Longimicrobiales bacterium]